MSKQLLTMLLLVASTGCRGSTQSEDVGEVVPAPKQGAATPTAAAAVPPAAKNTSASPAPKGPGEPPTPSEAPNTAAAPNAPTTASEDREAYNTFMPPDGQTNCIYTPAGGSGVYMPMDGGPELSCDRASANRYERVVLSRSGAPQLPRRIGDASCCSVEHVLNAGTKLIRGPFTCELVDNEIVCQREDGVGFAIGGPKVRVLGAKTKP